MERDAHLAPAREDVDGPVVVAAQVGPVGGRRLGELVHLLAQGGDVLLGLLEREGQLLVLRHGMCELALGLEQPLLERANPARRLLQAAPELGDLVFCLLGPAVQLLSIAIVCWEAGGLIALHRRDHLLKWRNIRHRRDPTPAFQPRLTPSGDVVTLRPRELAQTLSS